MEIEAPTLDHDLNALKSLHTNFCWV